jgi:hypothetical protein
MPLFQYRYDDTPMAVEIGHTNLYFHKWNNKEMVHIKDIESFGIAYWGDESISFETSTGASLTELLKVEQGTACILLKQNNDETIKFMEVNNSDTCMHLVNHLIQQFPKNWQGIAPYNEMTQILQIEEEWSFKNLVKAIIKPMAILYIGITLLVGLKYALNWL